MLRMIAALISLTILALSGWTSAGEATRANELAYGLQPNKPKYKVLALRCQAELFSTNVTNQTKTKVPEDAVITVHGVEAVCTQTASGPLAPGQSIKLPSCPTARTCRATAKWELP